MGTDLIFGLPQFCLPGEVLCLNLVIIIGCIETQMKRDLNWGTYLPWGRTPPPISSPAPPPKSMLDLTFSAFRIAISGTSTVLLLASVDLIDL
jgi:hypothetical protein